MEKRNEKTGGRESGIKSRKISGSHLLEYGSMHRNTILIPDRRMLYGLPEHAVRSDPVSERVKAFCLQYHEHKYIQKNRPIQEKFRAFFYCRSA